MIQVLSFLCCFLGGWFLCDAITEPSWKKGLLAVAFWVAGVMVAM